MKIINVVMMGAVGAAMLGVTGCINKDTKFAWGVDEGKNASASSPNVVAASRPPLDIPPSLLGKVEMPHAEDVAVNKAPPKRVLEAIAGKQVALDAKIYDQPAATVFSAALNAMTALNLPVISVDSASGTLTTDWVRRDSKSAGIMNILGGSGVLAVRYRFVARVLNQAMKTESGVDKRVTRFEIHTVAQAYKNNHWSNTELVRRYANELFARVDENLAQPSDAKQ